MRTKEGLRVEIRTLMTELARNGMNLKRAQRGDRVNEVLQLMMVRMEIWKSIAHRQGLLIEVIEVEAEYTSGRKAA